MGLLLREFVIFRVGEKMTSGKWGFSLENRIYINDNAEQQDCRDSAAL
jgi:hypothetical protein